MRRRDFLALCAEGGLLASASGQQGQAPKPPLGTQPQSNVGDKAMIVTPDQARVYSQGFGEAHILVDGERSGGTWWLGQFREDPGFMTALHLHPQTTEYFFVLEGVLSCFLDGKWYDLEAGATAQIPRGMPHAQGNTSGQPVRFVGWGSPSGFEQSFPEINELASRIAPSSPQWGSEMAKIISRHDTKVLGPPPRKT